MSQVDPAMVGQPRPSVQPRNFLRPCLLLLLGERPTYGYELRDKLEPLSDGHWDPGRVYRTLNTMEDDGLVHSTWERSAEGPRRRRYDITSSGLTVLDGWARELSCLRTTVTDFLDRYQAGHQDSVSLPGFPARDPPSAAQFDAASDAAGTVGQNGAQAPHPLGAGGHS